MALMMLLKHAIDLVIAQAAFMEAACACVRTCAAAVCLWLGHIEYCSADWWLYKYYITLLYYITI